MAQKNATAETPAPAPTHPELLAKLPTTYLVDTLEDDRQTQLAASVDVRNDGTLTFHDDDGAIVAAYHRDHWRRVQSERQSHATPSA